METDIRNIITPKEVTKELNSKGLAILKDFNENFTNYVDPFLRSVFAAPGSELKSITNKSDYIPAGIVSQEKAR